MTLEQFNLLARSEARNVLRPCVDIDRWVDAVVDARPYDSIDAVVARARESAAWSPAEVTAALARHPRIGARASGSGREATLSRSEQSGLGIEDFGVTEALLRGNAAYEEKFGQVFLVRAAGRSAAEILLQLDERLRHTPEEEAPVVAEQLREIALLRLQGVLGS